ncbi:hypothetical protein M422DRAFT_50814 [Sphaerobolus stellatus SS14]|uniref:DUF6533 domain-containing protein n=1 Tax=Sphaerobolus stellatus (strain SS14) TaxID=990650 RepID=A0A0C9V619_SPHS4|nr:hypothetical protein M422DRAFT_56016 [Sphaerobolus stellatus SS14]KIJ37017.1 hypothetical protein M422DRAFT_50814 [Sphaerobolus stellatus SS14]
MTPALLHLAARAVQSIHVLREKQVDTLATYSRITLYVYDILLNIDREKALIWKEGLRPSSLLYYLVRYPVIAKQIYFLLSTPQIPKYSAIRVYISGFSPDELALVAIHGIDLRSLFLSSLLG